MELAYLYIGGIGKIEDEKFKHFENTPYKVLKDVQLNFSNRFLFNYDHDHKELALVENGNYVPNFFDKLGKINNVTGIVGKNGTGKSSIVDLLIALHKGNYQKQRYKLIMVFTDNESKDDETQRVFKILHHQDLTVIPYTDNDVYKHSFNKDRIFQFGTSRLSNIIPKFKLIYYSPVFEIFNTFLDGLNESSSDQDVEDISTVKLLESDAEASKGKPMTNLDAHTVLRCHKQKEVERQLQFLLNIGTDHSFFDFVLPHVLEVSIDRRDEKVLVDTVVENFPLFAIAFDKLSKSDAKSEFINSIHRAVFFNFYNSFDDSFIDTKRFESLTDGLLENVQTDNVKQYLENVAVAIEEYLAARKIEPTNDLSIQIRQLVDVLMRFDALSADHFETNGFEGAKAYFDINDPFDASTLRQYFLSVNVAGFLSFDWRFSNKAMGQLSSGEKAMFSLFSRLYSVRDMLIATRETTQSLLILIDEGDQLFHPEWQRKFMNTLLKFLPIAFSFADSIQLILTTHSPFVASDLPSYSILRLKKNDEFTVVESPSVSNSTFAANVHELFTDSFYLENGLVGAFATEKIHDIFNQLDAPDSDKAKIRKEINLIGEPFIKTSLLYKLNSVTR